MENNALYEACDWEHGGIWNSGVPSPSWRDAQSTEVIQQRPPSYVCPTSVAEPIFVDSNPKFWLTGSPPLMSAATGSYAFSQGDLGLSATNIPNGTVMKCQNTGMFMYARRIRGREVTDGASKTFAVGEVPFADKLESLNLWTYAARLFSCLRLTVNPLNTPVCFPENKSFCGENFPESGAGDIWHNGAFGSEHPGGANFVYVDGHVTFVDDNVSLPVYQAASTRDGEEPETIQ
jgi:prepilin-type processing-associated H-X9-DG protein